MTLLAPDATTAQSQVLTPRLELHVPTAVERFHRLQAALPGTAVHYAVKANPHPVLLRALVTAGASFDVASPTEVRACLAAGARPGDLVYSNPIKLRTDIVESAALGVRLFVVDSPEETRKVAEAAPGAAVLCRLVTSGDGSDWPLSRKYGCSTSEAVDVLRLADELGLEAAGVSFHVGSQQRDTSAWDAPIEASSRVFAALRAAGLRPWLLDLGGGFPAALEGGAPRLEAYGEAIRRSLRTWFGSRRPRTLVEPGRSIVADAGRVVTTVVAVVHRGGTRWVYLDAGVFTGLVETLDEAIRYRLETTATGLSGPCVLAGPTCDSADVLYEKQPVHLPLSLTEGDQVVLDLRRRVHDVLLDRRLQRVRPAADAPHLAMTPVRRVVASHALAAVGMSVPWPLLVLLAWEQAGDGWALGLAGAARMLPYVVLSWAAGRLADRFARDRIVRLTLVARLVLLLGVVGALAADQTWAALGAATLAIAVATPAYPALAAAMPDLAGRRSEHATGLLVTVEVASFVVGPALGGLLLSPATRGLVPWVAVACLVGAWLLFDGVRLAAPSATSDEVQGSGVVRAIRSSAALRGAIGAVAAVNAVFALVGLALLPLLGDGAAFGVATAALGFGALGGPLLGRLGIRWRVGIRTWLLVLAGCLVLVVPAPSLWWAVPPLVVAGAAAVQVETAATATVQIVAPDRLRATVLGVTDTAMVAAAMLGALVAPTLAHLVGPHLVIALAAAGSIATVPLVRTPAVRETVAGPVPQYS